MHIGVSAPECEIKMLFPAYGYSGDDPFEQESTEASETKLDELFNIQTIESTAIPLSLDDGSTNTGSVDHASAHLMLALLALSIVSLVTLAWCCSQPTERGSAQAEKKMPMRVSRCWRDTVGDHESFLCARNHAKCAQCAPMPELRRSAIRAR